MRVLIVGAGIAGPTLAHWLARGGHEVTIVERGSAPREGGYLIDFWGAGFEVAARMGLVPRLMERAYAVREVREVDDRGRAIARIDPARLVAGAQGRFVAIARSDLAAVLLEALPRAVGTVFGDTVDTLVEHGDGVGVEFQSGTRGEYDLVIGADGVHSRVRQLVFGPEPEFERALGLAVAVFVLEDYEPRDHLVGVARTVAGAQVVRFAQRDGSTMVAVTFRHDGEVQPDDPDVQQRVLRTRLAGMGWEVPAMLAQLPHARSFYFDRASQIRMPGWSRGRVALVGDAAACASLLAGQGSALAMVEAYVLAAALNRAPRDHVGAFAAYERTLAPFVRAKQDAALRRGIVFAPRNRGELLMRRMAMHAMRIPPLADLAFARTLRDAIELPEPHVG